MKRGIKLKKKIAAIVPFVTIPIIIPIYCMLDSLFLVDIFGCGCVPSTQTNMLNIPFNANDLRLTVFSVLTIIFTAMSIRTAKSFRRKTTGVLYCAAALILNAMLTVWTAKTFMWA